MPVSARRDYKFGRQLGRGSFGVVHQVERKADGCSFVCKEIVLRGMKAKAREEANQEVELLRRISSGSEFVVNYIESFLERDSLHIIMEFCEHGDLSSFIKAQSGKPLGEEVIWKYVLQVGLGLNWLHTNRILHRDIKSLNVFLTDSDDARLGDLGVARVISDAADFASTFVGTPYYLSPEMCEQKPYNEKSDIWAYGCVLYELCTFHHAFDAQNQLALLSKIINGKYRKINEGYSQELRSLVSDCLLHDFTGRPSTDDILKLPIARSWASKLSISLPAEEAPIDDAERAQARKRMLRLQAQVSQLHDEAVRDLDAKTRLIWDTLYRLLWAKMGSAELTEEDQRELERYIFEELPPEHTDLISRACKILPLQQECDQCRALMA